MILHRYLARRFLKTFAAVFCIFLALNLLIDFLEHLRKFGGRDLDFLTIAKLVGLIAPTKIYTILPLIVVIASVTVFLALSRSSELVIARAAGRSAMRFLLGPILTTFVLGILVVAVFNPIVAGTSKRYEVEVAKVMGQAVSALSVSADGVWLRQGGEDEQILINAQRGSLSGSTLFNVTMFAFSPDGSATRRIEAEQATLQNGYWDMRTTRVWNLQRGTKPADTFSSAPSLAIPTNLTLNQIRDSFGTPASIAIWDLPQFIGKLEETGFSARRHRVWFHMELALPLFLSAVALIGAAFTIRPSRLQNAGMMVLGAILCGFGLFFIRNFAQVLAEYGQLSAALAAWVPPLAAIGLALGLILQQEDG